MTTRRPGETRDPVPGIEQSLASAMAGELDMGAFLVQFANAGIFLPSQTDPADGGVQPLFLAPQGEARMAVFTARDRTTLFASAAPFTTVMLGRHILEGLQPGVGLLVNPGSGLGFEMDPVGVAPALQAVAAAHTPGTPDPNIALEQAIIDAGAGIATPERLLEVLTSGTIFVLTHSREEIAPFTFLREGGDSFVGLFTRPEYAQPYAGEVEHVLYVDAGPLIEKINAGFGLIVNPGSPYPWEVSAEVVEGLR
jgi:hypothetical protein